MLNCDWQILRELESKSKISTIQQSDHSTMQHDSDEEYLLIDSKGNLPVLTFDWLFKTQDAKAPTNTDVEKRLRSPMLSLGSRRPSATGHQANTAQTLMPCQRLIRYSNYPERRLQVMVRREILRLEREAKFRASKQKWQRVTARKHRRVGHKMRKAKQMNDHVELQVCTAFVSPRR